MIKQVKRALETHYRKKNIRLALANDAKLRKISL